MANMSGLLTQGGLGAVRAHGAHESLAAGGVVQGAAALHTGQGSSDCGSGLVLACRASPAAPGGSLSPDPGRPRRFFRQYFHFLRGLLPRRPRCCAGRPWHCPSVTISCPAARPEPAAPNSLAPHSPPWGSSSAGALRGREHGVEQDANLLQQESNGWWPPGGSSPSPKALQARQFCKLLPNGKTIAAKPPPNLRRAPRTMWEAPSASTRASSTV